MQLQSSAKNEELVAGMAQLVRTSPSDLVTNRHVINSHLSNLKQSTGGTCSSIKLHESNVSVIGHRLWPVHLSNWSIVLQISSSCVQVCLSVYYTVFVMIVCFLHVSVVY